MTIHRLRSDHGIAGACPWDGIGRLTALCARDVGFEISAGAGDNFKDGTNPEALPCPAPWPATTGGGLGAGAGNFKHPFL